MSRYIYLCGPVEVEGDTWREKTAEKLLSLGFHSIDPVRNENLRRVGKHIQSDIDDKMMVRRDLNDLERTRLSGGLILANLQTTSDGRTPMGSLFELMWAYIKGVPVVTILNSKVDVHIRTHPWVRYCSTYEASSMTDALKIVELYFSDFDYRKEEDGE